MYDASLECLPSVNIFLFQLSEQAINVIQKIKAYISLLTVKEWLISM